MAHSTDEDIKKDIKVIRQNLDELTDEDIKKDIKTIRRNLDTLDRALACADENSLFENITNDPNAPKYENIINNMADVYEELGNKEHPP